MGGKRALVALVYCMAVGLSVLLSAESTNAFSYIALGDSFTSGEGETSDELYQFKENPPALLCHNSNRSYPYIVAAQLGFDPQATHSVACSGARTLDIVGGDDYYGQANRLIKNDETADLQKVSDIQLDALQTFAPGITRQMVFIDYYRPDIVTIGVGGNDVGMVEKLKACMMVDTCEWASDRDTDARIKAGREIRDLFYTLVPAYRYLAGISPHSHFYAVGYPTIINSDSLCNPSLNAMFNGQEKLFMNQSISYLNTVVEDAARAAGLVFIPQEHAFSGNALCDATSTPAMNDIRFGDDIAPIADIQQLKLFGNESFHPTPYGHFLLSQSIALRLAQDVATNFLDYPAFASIDAQPSTPPVYWKDDGKKLPRQVSAPDMTTQTDKSNQLVLRLPAQSFKPHTDAVVLVHSHPLRLAQLEAGGDGSLVAIITLPQELEQGFHTIIVQGIDPNRDEVEYYKVVYHDSTSPPIPIPTASSPPDASGTPALVAATPPAETTATVLGVSTSQRHSPFVLRPKNVTYQWTQIVVLLGLVLIGILGILYKLRRGT